MKITASDEKKLYRYLLKIVNKPSAHFTWNVPPGGYSECNYCSRAMCGNGLCEWCGERLRELEQKYGKKENDSYGGTD